MTTTAHVWLGLVVMAIAWPIEWVIKRFEVRAAQTAFQRHECPECGVTLGQDAPEGPKWVCESCGFVGPTESEPVPA